MQELKDIIRDIPDFPKKGIIFKDITTLLADAKSYQKMVDLIAHRYVGERVDKVVGVEARGFIIGAALAYKLGAGIVLVADTLEEAIGLAHTIIVVKDGEIRKRFDCRPGAKPSLYDLLHHMI